MPEMLRRNWPELRITGPTQEGKQLKCAQAENGGALDREERRGRNRFGHPRSSGKRRTDPSATVENRFNA
jgi:hypothetical protein